MKYSLTFFTLVILTVLISSTMAQVNWTKYPSPVLTRGFSGDWDEKNVLMPSVLFDGSVYHLWYVTYDFVAERSEYIGYATSSDGISWTKYDDPSTTDPPFS